MHNVEPKGYKLLIRGSKGLFHKYLLINEKKDVIEMKSQFFNGVCIDIEEIELVNNENLLLGDLAAYEAYNLYTEEYNLEFTLISFSRLKREIYVTMDGGRLGKVQFQFDINAIRYHSSYFSNSNTNINDLDLDLEMIPLTDLIDISYEMYILIRGTRKTNNQVNGDPYIHIDTSKEIGYQIQVTRNGLRELRYFIPNDYKSVYDDAIIQFEADDCVVKEVISFTLHSLKVNEMKLDMAYTILVDREVYPFDAITFKRLESDLIDVVMKGNKFSNESSGYSITLSNLKSINNMKKQVGELTLYDLNQILFCCYE
ncbi:hypothetical protein AB1J99_31205 [Bacillus bombysepticus]